jgi:hypothetical protein
VTIPQRPGCFLPNDQPPLQTMRMGLAVSDLPGIGGIARLLSIGREYVEIEADNSCTTFLVSEIT